MRAVLLCLLLACHRDAAPLETPEAHARALIDALERGDAEPLAALITPESTWDGLTAKGIAVSNTTKPADLVAAGAASRDIVGAFRRVAFVWTERDYVYVVTEHASGDFVFMLRFDADQHLGHLTFTSPDHLPRSGCSIGWGKLNDDGSISSGPAADTPPTVAIVGTLGGTGVLRLHDLAAGLSCKGIASVLMPDGKPFLELPPSVRLVVAHTRDHALVSPGVEALELETFLPAPNRESGRSIIDGSHVAQSVIDQIAARAR